MQRAEVAAAEVYAQHTDLSTVGAHVHFHASEQLAQDADEGRHTNVTSLQARHARSTIKHILM